MERVLTIEDLYVSFDTYAGEVKAVRGVSLHVDKGEVLAIVGESGCGKSVTAQSVMRLNPEPPARIVYGSITLCGQDVVHAGDKQLRSIRGKDVSMIFQDPMTSLNPTMPIGKQLTEAIRHHQGLGAAEASQRAVELLEQVRIPNAAQRVKQYPHEFSGGMRQRVMIAMALSCSPQLLIADEPTTALDVTIQAQIIDLLAAIQKETQTAIILITHDLGVVAGMAHRVAVMYAGKIVETGSQEDIFYRHAHPYTEALLNSLPRPDIDRSSGRLVSIPGSPPDLFQPPKGCPFAGRCSYAMKICQEQMPPNFPQGEGHEAACWLLHKDCPKTMRGGAKE
ncbi:MAG: ABC transporter ATP-binding protein [Christensenellaceae bacterium]|jgi:oligopeptide transport system ATP-binding protein|nr:ABC transporter ATP-binding protein [Christensenellaceae bacterium]